MVTSIATLQALKIIYEIYNQVAMAAMAATVDYIYSYFVLPILLEKVMLFANSKPVLDMQEMQEIDAALLASVSGGAYFWDDLQGTANPSNDTVINTAPR